MPVIGFLNSALQLGFTTLLGNFRGGLAEEGFRDGDNVEIRSSYADGNYGTLDNLASDLVKAGVDIIAPTGGFVSAQAAARATSTIPVLFIAGCRPDVLQFVSPPGLKGPPANSTGVALCGTESLWPRLSHFRELMGSRGANKFAVLVRPGTDISVREVDQARAAYLTVVEATTEDDLRKAFAAVVTQKLDGLLVSADPFFTSQRNLIVALASQYKLPVAYPWREYTDIGGLMSCGASLSDAYHRVGQYAGRILKGAKPQDRATPISVVDLCDFKLVINGKSASEFGLPISPSLRAHSEVI